MILKPSIYNNVYQFGNERYVYNSHSGCLVRLDDDVYSFLTNIVDSSDINTREIYMLFRQKGFIVPQYLDEFGQYRMMGLKQRFDAHPQNISFVIVTTTACNYKCFYCYEQGIESKSMDYSTQNQVAAYIEHEIARSGCTSLHLSWFGGEPLLNIECIDSLSRKVIEICEKANVQYSASLITNGSLLDDKVLDKLVTDWRIEDVQITIDGDRYMYQLYKSCKYEDYERVFTNLVELSKTVRLNVRLNTDGENYQHIKSFLRDIIIADSDLSYTSFYLARIHDVPWRCQSQLIDLQLDFLSFLYKKKLRRSLWNSLPKSKYVSCGLMQQYNAVIGPDGTMFRCEHSIGERDSIIGNVREGRYYNSAEYKFIDDGIDNECATCSMYPICRNGCAYRRINMDEGQDCAAFKQIIERTLFYITLLDREAK